MHLWWFTRNAHYELHKMRPQFVREIHIKSCEAISKSIICFSLVYGTTSTWRCVKFVSSLRRAKFKSVSVNFSGIKQSKNCKKLLKIWNWINFVFSCVLFRCLFVFWLVWAVLWPAFCRKIRAIITMPPHRPQRQ